MICCYEHTFVIARTAGLTGWLPIKTPIQGHKTLTSALTPSWQNQKAAPRYMHPCKPQNAFIWTINPSIEGPVMRKWHRFLTGESHGASARLLPTAELQVQATASF